MTNYFYVLILRVQDDILQNLILISYEVNEIGDNCMVSIIQKGLNSFKNRFSVGVEK